MKKRKKILIIRFSSFGDVILIHPVIKKLYKSGYDVDLLTKKRYAELFHYNPYVKSLFVLEDYKSLFQLGKKIKQQNYFKILDLHKNLRTSLLKMFFFKDVLTYKKYRFKRFLLIYFKINLLKNNFVIKNYLEPLKKLNILLSERDCNYKIFFRESKKIKAFRKKNFIVISPFAKYYTKNWVYYQDLIKILRKKINIIIIGEKKHYNRAEKWKHKNVFNLCGKLNFNDIVYLINLSRLLITNDSGIMHLGAGTKIPLISIFGSTTGGFGFIPLRRKCIILENKNLHCRPCHYHGKNACPKVHFKCMKDISVEIVLKNVKKFIKI